MRNIIIVLTLILLNCNLKAAVCVNGLKYELNEENKTAELTGIANKDSLIETCIIPDTIIHDGENYLVTSIKERALAYSKIENLILPKSIKEIGKYFCHGSKVVSVRIESQIKQLKRLSFWFCQNLKQIEMPASLEEIGEGVFSGCDNLSTVKLNDGLKKIGKHAFYGCDSLKKIIIPESVNYIGTECFGSCKFLSSISLPKYLKALCWGVFQGCTGLKHITLPDSLQTIEFCAFLACDSLEEIHIPSKVSRIDEVFEMNQNLKKITVDKRNEYFKSHHGILFNKKGNILIRYPEAKRGRKYVIPNRVDSICSYSLHKLQNLETVVLSKNVTVLPYRAISSVMHLTIDCRKTSFLTIRDDALCVNEYLKMLVNKGKYTLSYNQLYLREIELWKYGKGIQIQKVMFANYLR